MSLSSTLYSLLSTLYPQLSTLYSLLSIIILVSACGGKKGEVVIRGHFDHLNQADFFIYSLDNNSSAIDTIHVKSGRFEYTCMMEGEAIFHIVYPHMAEQIVFAADGDVIDVEGDAANLRDVKVSGNADNKAYTRLRHTMNQAASEAQRDSIMQDYIDANPQSRVSIYLQHQMRLHASEKPLVVKGKKLPDFRLIDHENMDTTVIEKKRAGHRLFNADTLSLADLKGRRTLMVFWSHWLTGSNRISHQIREVLAEDDSLTVVSYSADVKYHEHFSDIRSDSCLSDKYNKRWYAYCDLRGPGTGLLARWAIRDLPYYILVDAKGVVSVCSRDFDKDIRPQLKK